MAMDGDGIQPKEIDAELGVADGSARRLFAMLVLQASPFCWQ